MLPLLVLLGTALLVSAEHTHDAPFFENNVTQETTWERPANMPLFAEDGRPYWIVDGHASWMPAKQVDAWQPRWDPDGHPFFESLATTGEATWERPPSMGWTARSSKRSYYHNVVSGETVSERPHVLGHHSEEHDATYYIGRDGLPTWEAPEASSWEAHRSEEHNRPFFHNPKTGETVWEAHADTNVAWQQWFHEVEEL